MILYVESGIVKPIFGMGYNIENINFHMYKVSDKTQHMGSSVKIDTIYSMYFRRKWMDLSVRIQKARPFVVDGLLDFSSGVRKKHNR